MSEILNQPKTHKEYLPTKFLRRSTYIRTPEHKLKNSIVQKKRWALYHAEKLKKNNNTLQDSNNTQAVLNITKQLTSDSLNTIPAVAVNNYNGVTDNDGVDNKDNNNFQTLNNSQNINTNNTNLTNLSQTDNKMTFKDFTNKIVPKMQRLTVSILDNLSRQAKYQGTIKSADSTALAIIIDKLQLLTGRATSNISVVRYNFSLRGNSSTPPSNV